MLQKKKKKEEKAQLEIKMTRECCSGLRVGFIGLRTSCLATPASPSPCDRVKPTFLYQNAVQVITPYCIWAYKIQSRSVREHLSRTHSPSRIHKGSCVLFRLSLEHSETRCLFSHVDNFFFFLLVSVVRLLFDTFYGVLYDQKCISSKIPFLGLGLGKDWSTIGQSDQAANIITSIEIQDKTKCNSLLKYARNLFSLVTVTARAGTCSLPKLE